MGGSECQDDVHKIESQCMVVKMTVLSFCREDECGFQSETSTASKAVGAVATTAALALAARRVGVAATSALGLAYLVGSFFSEHLAQSSKAEVDEEAEFKRQFVAYVTKKQQLIIDSPSANCSNQVEL